MNAHTKIATAAHWQVRYRRKTPYRDGATHTVLQPLDFVARLAALMPPPRVHVTRFHGGFATRRALIASIGRGMARWSAGATAREFRPLADRHPQSHITSMALSKKKATTIALDPDDDRLLSRAARERGISRAEFIRQHLALVLDQYRRHPKPRSAGAVRSLRERGNESELFGGGR